MPEMMRVSSYGRLVKTGIIRDNERVPDPFPGSKTGYEKYRSPAG